MKYYVKLTIESYNTTAEEYLEKVKEFEDLPEISRFMSLAKTHNRILDLGCGPGHHSKIFSEMGHEVIGIDLSKSMIRIAKRTAPTAEFYTMDIRGLTFEIDTFDAIWASASLIHLKKQEIRPTLNNLKSILKPNGLLYISLKEGIGEKISSDIRYRNVKKFHSYYLKSEIEEIVEELRFEKFYCNVRAKRSTYDTESWIHLFLINK